MTRPTPVDVAFYVPSVGALLKRTAVHRGGGAETQVYLLARELARQGCRVVLVCYPVSGGLPVELEGIRIVVRSPSRGDRRVIGGLLEIFATLRVLLSLDARVYVQRAAGYHTGVVGIAAWLKRRRFIYSSAATTDFDAPHIPRIPRRLHELRELRAKALFWTGIALAEEIVVQTDEQAEMCRARFRREPTLIRSIAEPAPPRTSRPDSFLWVGRADPQKRPLDYVALATALPEAKFRMVALRGGGTAAVTGAQLNRAAAGVQNLELLGGLPRAELAHLMDRAVAIVSTSQYEGMPNVFLEAWARGVPVLALHHDPDGVIEHEGLGSFAHGSFNRLVEQARALWAGGVQENAAGDRAVRCRTYVERHHAPAPVARRWARLLG